MKGYLKRFSLLISALLFAFVSVNFVVGQLLAAPEGTSAAVRYVDGASGSDSGGCRQAASPCKTIGYALKRAVDGNTIYVAQGTYVENLIVTRNIRMEGGYEAAGWTRDIKKFETIIDGSDGQYEIGDWDGRMAMQPTVIKDGEQYRMWYDGRDVVGTSGKVGAASSADGKAWSKYENNPVLSGDSGKWDEFAEPNPFVLQEKGRYTMWYQATYDGKDHLGYATSPDGLKWTKYRRNPIMEPGPDDYDRDDVGSGSILKEDGLYKLWYQAAGDLGGIIAYATSTNGRSWTKVGPALTPSSSGWDSRWLWGPSVHKIGDTYWMWYSGNAGEGCAIGASTSSDGLNWTRVGVDPVLGDPDTGCETSQTILVDNGTLKMWYTTFDGDPWRGFIDYAESSDGINWTKYSGNPVLFPGELGQEGVPVVFFDNISGGAVLDGFTIRNGFAAEGAGIELIQSDIVVQNSTIYNNRALNVGGGIRLFEGSHLTATNNVIYNNDAGQHHGGGIAIDSGSRATIVHNVIYDNAAGSGGGGVGSWEHKGSVTLVDNHIYDNEAGWGAGILFDNGDGDVVIAGNNVHGNEALNGDGGGVGIFDIDGSINIEKNLFFDNVASTGGALYISGRINESILVDSNQIRDNGATEDWGTGGPHITNVTTATVSNNVIANNNYRGMKGVNFETMFIINNTIVDNGLFGMEIFGWPTAPPDPLRTMLTNNIIVGHSQCAVRGFNGALFTADFNDFWKNGDEEYCDLFSGSNISQHPRFVNRSAGNFRLRPNSPAIDAGTSKYAPLHDIDGNERPFGSGFDMGAYEWPPYHLELPVIIGAK